MGTYDAAEKHITRSAHCASETPVGDGARQDPAERRMLYVLGFGIAGAICANASVYGYFALFYASG